MATRKCRNINFPKYFMVFRKFPNIYHITKYFCEERSELFNLSGRCINLGSGV